MARPARREASGPGGGRTAIFTPNCLEDLRWWVATNPRTARRVLDLVEATLGDPFAGLGKPEPLRYLGPDFWSRRITEEHRLVYRVFGDRIEFHQARFHY